MKKGLLIFLSFILVFPLFFGFIAVGDADAKTVRVEGYYRKDGTYVKPHTRNYGGSSNSYTTTPSYYIPNNSNQSYPTPIYSTEGIVNLYKGEKLAGQAYVDELVYVDGYYREDGTYVRPHFKTHANKYVRDNFSYLGLSTLLPLSKKYPTYKYSKSDDVAAIQHYLYANTLTHSLSSWAFYNLTEYANSLNEDADDYMTGVNGRLFYYDLGYDYNMSDALVRFDKSGILTAELYLYQIIKAMGIKKLLYNQQSNLEKYAELLTNHSTENETQVMEMGREFYKSIGLKSEDIETQIKLDMLQVF